MRFRRTVADLTGRCASLTSGINQLEQEIAERVTTLAPTLLTIVGCVSLTAAKILGEIAGVDRFRSKDAYGRYAGTAPLRVWTGNRERHRLNRVGNRQLNTALHRIAITTGPLPPRGSATARTPTRGRRQHRGVAARPQAPTLRRRLSSTSAGPEANATRRSTSPPERGLT